MYIVYLRTNTVNGKQYVGLTSMSIEDRAGVNGSRYKNCPYLYNAILKYGWDNFESTILAADLTHEKACELEKYYVELYGTVAPNGYNLTVGGDSGSLHTEETKKVLSQKLKGNKSRTGYKNSERHRHRMSEVMKGNTNTLGKHWSEDARRNMLLGQPHRVRIVQLTKQGEFVAEYESLADAERHTGIRWQNIGKVVAEKPGYYSAGGFLWKKRGK